MTRAELEREYEIRSELIQRRCRNNLFEFVKEFWDIIIQEDPVYNFHIPFICSILEEAGRRLLNREEKEHDILFNVPPGTTKSTLITVMFPAWLMANDPSMRIINNSHSGGLATDHAVKSKDIIQSPRFQRYFPEVEIRRDVSGKTQYWTTRGGARETTSTTSGSTGIHALLILNDDPQNAENAESEAHTKQSIEKTRALASRKVSKSVTLTVTITQRLNEKDVSAYLLGNKAENLLHIKLPAELTKEVRPIPEDAIFQGKTILQWYEENGGLLDPIRLSRKDLDEAKVDLGSRQYAGQYQQNPTVEGGDIVKRAWFEIVSRARYDSRKKLGKGVQFFMDTAYTEKKENDPSGIIAADMVDNIVYILAAAKVRKEFPELVRWLREWAPSYGYTDRSMIRIEPKANGLSVIQQLKRGTMMNVTQTPTPKDGKSTRLHAVSPRIEAGRVKLIEGAWNDDFLDEVTGFPNAPHDEYVDLLVYAINHFLKDEGVSNIESIANIL